MGTEASGSSSENTCMLSHACVWEGIAVRWISVWLTGVWAALLPVSFSSDSFVYTDKGGHKGRVIWSG